MAPKKILMVCSNSWTSLFQVGSHHLAREFVKLGYEVGYVSDPISPLHLLGSVGLKERYEIYKAGGIRDNGVWTYVPGTLIPPNNKPLLRSEWVHRHWHQMTYPNVVQKVIQQGFGEVDILYFDTAIHSFWIDQIRARKTVFRVADHNAGFKKSTPALLQMEKELIQKVDLVVCTAKSLMEEVAPQTPRVAHLPNGVRMSHFSQENSVPKEYTNIPKPIAVYVGAIEYWFNYALVKKMALELPHVSFVLIGPAKENPFKELKNVYLLGPRSYSEVPDYLKHADVGMIPFDVENHPDLIHNVNPLKLYEYMACGLPVVSTRWRELETIDSPALLCRSADEFKEGILAALREPQSKQFYQNYAAKQDWSTRGKQLIELLK